jgi:hypothetical protein
LYRRPRLRIRILFVIEMKQICDHWPTDTSKPILSLHVPYCERSRPSIPVAHAEAQRIMNCQFNADPNPDPAFHSNVDPDREPTSKNNADPFRSGSVHQTTYRSVLCMYVLLFFLMLTKLAKITFLQEQIRTRKNTVVRYLPTK